MRKEVLKPTVGFEPTTTGLQNQSSTVELRWRYVRSGRGRSADGSAKYTRGGEFVQL